MDFARDCYTSAVEGDPYSYVALQAWGVLEVRKGEGKRVGGGVRMRMGGGVRDG